MPTDAGPDVVVVGGGHNALVAATYLARAGLAVTVLERLDHLGGAAVSERPFVGVDAHLSRYAYLVSLFPTELAADLGIDLQLRSRSTASYTPEVRDGVHTGLIVESRPGDATWESFAALTGSGAAARAWSAFYADVADLAQVLAPTYLQPLPSGSAVRDRLAVRTGQGRAGQVWRDLVDQPIGTTIDQRFDDDLVRGVVATDALIGTFTDLGDPARLANRCLLYHLTGNATGEWRVPVGGMGAVTGALANAAWAAGARLLTSADVDRVDADGRTALVYWTDTRTGVEHHLDARWILGGLAPAALDRLLDRQSSALSPEGAQLKLNMLLTRLPALRSGVDPRVAFAGTFHVDERASDLDRAFRQARSGFLPDTIPGELYCHTLTDPSILAPELAARGWHTLTYFGLHTPARLFAGADHEAVRDAAAERAIAGLDAYLAEPLADCLAVDADARPCLEARSPRDVEADLAMPGGHIFHGDLAWPWLENAPEGPAEAWGVATGIGNVLLCGSGARRGGAVSGIGGHNAAQALLELVGRA